MSWLIAPNALIVEHAAVPEVEGPPSVRKGRSGGAAPGTIATALVRLSAAYLEVVCKLTRPEHSCHGRTKLLRWSASVQMKDYGL